MIDSISNLSPLSLRPAGIPDEDFAFKMVTAAGRGMVETYLGAGSRTKARDIFRVIWSGHPNQFHYSNCWIACREEVPLGMVCAYPAHSGSRSSLNIPQLIWAGGWRLVLHYLSHPGQLGEVLTLPEGRKGEFYIATVAAEESARGQGIGTALLNHCMQLTRKEGLQKASLMVARDNPRARDLYLRQGFREDESPESAHPLAMRMVRLLDAETTGLSRHG